jgi:AcrR family transcriptional regulator
MSQYKKSIDVKNRILRASEELFALNGYDATGIAQIAAKSEITKSLLYYYFDSKEQILEELFSNYLLKVREEKRKILSSGLSEAEIIKQSMLIGFSLLSNNKKIIRILIAEILKGNVNKEALCNIIESIIPASMTDLKLHDDIQRHTNELTAYTFFFGLAPMIAYMLFGETWIKNNQLEETAFINQFLTMAIASFTNDITGVTAEFFEPQKDTLIDNLKKLL